jgi:transposase
MDHFARLDVSVKETSVCIVDDTGRIVREVRVASEPESLLQELSNPGYHFKRIGLEAGPLSQWLFSALAEAGLPVICVETRHMRTVLKAQINKTDRNDARGMAQMMRVGLYRPVHVKTLRSQKQRMLLTHRKLLQSKTIAIDNDLRGTLRLECYLMSPPSGCVGRSGRLYQLPKIRLAAMSEDDLTHRIT